MRRIALVNQKGGCGKTTTAINLASGLAMEGRKVLLIDLDPQGHSGLGLGAGADASETGIYDVLLDKIPLDQALRKMKANLDIILSDVVLSAFEQIMSGAPEREYRLRNCIQGIEDQYDYLIIDSPPSVGLLTFNGLMAADEVIIPVDASYFSLHGLKKLLETLEVVNEETEHHLFIRILITNVDPRTNFSKGVIATLTTHFPEYVFTTIIHSCTRLREAASLGKSIMEFDRHCNAFRDYQELTREVIRQEKGIEESASRAAYLAAHRARYRDGKDVIFSVTAPAGADVRIAGDFNGWRPEPLKYRGKLGQPSWQKLIPLKPGAYQYKYLIDGKWVTDPENDQKIGNSYGDYNSVVSV